MVERQLTYLPWSQRQDDDMPIHRLNHAVLYVRDVARSVAFYRDVLGFAVVSELPGARRSCAPPASTNDHDLGLFQLGAPAGAVGRRAQHGRAVPPGLGGRDAAATSRRWPTGSPRPGRWSGRRTTAPPSRCTATTRTAWSSRWPGSCRPTGSTRPRSPAARDPAAGPGPRDRPLRRRHAGRHRHQPRRRAV